ncbi:hypothetical protein [Tortoise microvirus 64]|nr:hypothetical protein [Tortoise microvirus 64]
MITYCNDVCDVDSRLNLTRAEFDKLNSVVKDEFVKCMDNGHDLSSADVLIEMCFTDFLTRAVKSYLNL